MKQNVLVVLVVLVLINILINYYLLVQIKNFEEESLLSKYHIDRLYEYVTDHDDRMVKSLHYINAQLKEIPREITVKNVLSIP